MKKNFRNAAQVAATMTNKVSYPVMSDFENGEELVDVLVKRYGSSFIPEFYFKPTPKMVEVICKTGKGVFANDLAGALSAEMDELASFDVSYTFDFEDNIDQIIVTGAMEELDDLTIGTARCIKENMSTSDVFVLDEEQSDVIRSWGTENFLGMVKAELDHMTTPDNAEIPTHELLNLRLVERADGTFCIELR